MFAVLGLGEAVARLIGFAGTVYVARTLGVESYGIIAVAAAIVLYFAQIANYSVEMLGAREIAKALGETGADDLTSEQSGRRSASMEARWRVARAAVHRIVPPLLAARLLVASGCIALLVTCGMLGMGTPEGSVLAIGAFTLLAVASSTRFTFVGLEQPITPAVASVTGELLSLGIVLLFVHNASDVRTVPISRIVGEVGTSVLMLLVLRRMGVSLSLARGAEARTRAMNEVVKPVFSAATPLVIHAMLGLAIFNSDLIFLRAMRDARTAGMYAAAYTLISFLLNLGVTYGSSILPALSRAHDDAPKQQSIYDQAMLQMLTVAIPVAVGGALLAGGLLDLVFGSRYVDAVRPLQILMWSIVVAWVRNVVQIGLIARDQQAFILRTTIWSAAVNTVFNLLLIPSFGMIGAAAATLITESIRTLVALWYAERLELPFGVWRQLWQPTLGATCMGATVWFVPFPHVVVAVAAGAAVYGIVLLATGGIRVVNGSVRFGT